MAVGAGLGWIIDRVAGTSPFGLIVFLLLGFGAGVLNVMRSAGVVAEAGIKLPPKDGGEGPKRLSMVSPASQSAFSAKTCADAENMG